MFSKKESKKFALLGAAGYVAPRHMMAIKENGCKLVAAMDPSDSVGVIDSYFPKASFFTEIEKFDRHVNKLSKTDDKIDYFSICSPNYLHDSHIRLALRSGCDAICEKPLVIRPKNLKYLKDMELDTNKKVNCILQLRHHDTIVEMRNKYKDIGHKKNIDLKYITSRGMWYNYSWKGDDSKSGGLAMNIGVHFFDMLSWIFGDLIDSSIDIKTKKSVGGVLKLKKANVNWFLSIDENMLPSSAISSGQRAYRSILIDNEELEFSGGFKDLHTKSYEMILQNKGFGLDDVAQSLSIVHDIYNKPYTE